MKYSNIKKIIENFFSPNLRNKSAFKSIINNLFVADVGSTGGLNSRWNLINELTKTFSFDPDARAYNIETKKNKIFPFALWSEEQDLTLNLTAFPDASSIYELNNNILEKFLNYECHRVISRSKINSKPLDNIDLKNEDIDFLKIDTEGAELEILKGSKKYLGKSILGLELEVQFINRTIGSPIFSDIDNFLRPFGYQLMTLYKQSWIRKNNVWNINSNPQIIWADAVYIMNEENLISKISKIDKKSRESTILKLMAICLVYGFYDYCISILNKLEKNNLLVNDLKYYSDIIKSNVRSNIFIISLNLLRFIFSLILILFILFLWTKRRSVFSFFKSSAASLFHSLYSIFSRNGPYNVAINDFIK